MLNEAQATTLAAAIRASADANVIAALAIRNDVILTEWCNSPSTFVAWRKSVPADEYRKALTWTEIDALTAGKARIFDWLTAGMTQPLDSSDANVRAGLADAFASNTTTRASLLAICKRFATKCEALFATGTGTDATPGALVVEGSIGLTEVSTALNRNP